MAIIVSNVSGVAPTAAGGNGSLTYDVDVSGGSGAQGLIVSVYQFDATAPGNKGTLMYGIGGITPGPGLVLPNLPAGKYVVEVTEVSGPAVGTGTGTVPAYVPPPVVPGCTDPEADNYNPDATSNNGSCTYSPRLVLDAPMPALVANGRPVPVVLHSAAIPGAVPSKAQAFINVEQLAGAGVLLTVNGYELRSGPLVDATAFSDGPTLLEALQGIPALAGAYVIKQTQDEEVSLTARVEGTPGNLNVTTSAPLQIVIANVDGVNRYRSQNKAQFGVWLEVWCGSPQAGGGGTYADLYTDLYRDHYGILLDDAGSTTSEPQLAQRLELDFRTDNAYEFDIAPALRQFTGHAYPRPDGTCPDRLTSYYLRYGELYATDTTTRRQRTAYQSGVAWALDAVEIVAPLFGHNYVLTSRPQPVRGYRGAALPCLLLGIETAPSALRSIELAARDYAGDTYRWGGTPPVLGEVYRFSVPPTFLQDRLTAEFTGYAADGYPVARLELLADPVPELSFPNGQGGFDTVAFEGTREEIVKRLATYYATSTGTATRLATTPEAFRLNSGQLSREEYTWLRREMGNTPDVYLETPGGPVLVLLTGWAFEADEVKGEYSLAVDCTPATQPALGLVN